MSSDLPAPLVLLLHEGGWDEVLMVAISLGVAYFVIVWSGRRNRDEDEVEEGGEVADGRSPEAETDSPPQRRE
jgi:hypothetical protein